MLLPYRGYRRAMAKLMTLAAKIPHFHYVEEINCDALVELKASFQNENSDPNVKHTFLPVLIKSLSMALSKYPFLNSCFNEELQTVTVKGLYLFIYSFYVLYFHFCLLIIMRFIVCFLIFCKYTK